jgi:hypothetical protein
VRTPRADGHDAADALWKTVELLMDAAQDLHLRAVLVGMPREAGA